MADFGLYKKEYEHDSCGIGFVADIKGRSSHGIVGRALEVLERMTHRGAESADNKTGDGAGVLLRIPHGFYKALLPALPAAGEYGTGLLFLPKDAAAQDAALAKIDALARPLGLCVSAVRDVPVDSSVLGDIARNAEPAVKQVFLIGDRGQGIGGGSQGTGDRGQGTGDRGQRTGDREQGTVGSGSKPSTNADSAVSTDIADTNLPPTPYPLPPSTALYLLRKRFENFARTDEGASCGLQSAYFPSLSDKTIVYKGMLMPEQLRLYYADLRDERLESPVALVHSRFSTNTFPAWALSQPFRLLAHNGEINTVKGNRFWAAAREALYQTEALGVPVADILPVIEPDKSDSASFDNMLEFLVACGRPLPQALAMLIPEAWNDKNPVSAAVKAFYEYHACMMEPWDGPASIVFYDGRYVGGTLDRNGLRPSRYCVTKSGMIVMASETGVQDFAPAEIEYKGRLLPGKLLLVDVEAGRIIPDTEVKEAIAAAAPYGEWVKANVRTLPQEEDAVHDIGHIHNPPVEGGAFNERFFEECVRKRYGIGSSGQGIGDSGQGIGDSGQGIGDSIKEGEVSPSLPRLRSGRDVRASASTPPYACLSATPSAGGVPPATPPLPGAHYAPFTGTDTADKTLSPIPYPLSPNTTVFHSDALLLRLQLTNGYSREDREKLLVPMAAGGAEPTNSMGTDTPLAVFSDLPQRPFAYFKQMFAQVTNPPVDSIREDLVMTLTSFVGPQPNMLRERPENCRRIKVKNPVITPEDLERLLAMAEREYGWKPAELAAVFKPDAGQVKAVEAALAAHSSVTAALSAYLAGRKPPKTGLRITGSLERALDALVEEACAKVQSGAELLVLSDRAVGAIQGTGDRGQGTVGSVSNPSTNADSAASTDISAKPLPPTPYPLPPTNCPIPSLLAVGAVHHGLIAAGLRMKTSLVVESAEPREIMHFALLFGYGADLVCPYGALASIAEIVRNAGREGLRHGGGVHGAHIGDYRHSVKNYLKGMQKALLKVMSKMGTSTLRSYRGAQIFEALGLGQQVIEKCFKGTESRIGGVTFADLEAEAVCLWVVGAIQGTGDRGQGTGGWESGVRSRESGVSPTKLARSQETEFRNRDILPDSRFPIPDSRHPTPDPRPPTPPLQLYRTGQYSYRKDGEVHAWNPESVHLLQWAARTGDYAKFKEWTRLCDTLNRRPHVIRGLLDFAPAGEPVSLDEVESVDEIMKRFTTGAMSFGSISKEAHETIAAALNSIHGRSNSGEGGEDPARFAPRPAADGGAVWTRSAIKQVASGRFGVTSEYLANCVELQIKMAQGAKPGEGGQLPGHKVDAEIGRVRHSTPGVTLISPPPHHDIYSIEDLAQLIFDLKNANREARISVKLVSEAGVGTVAAGVAKAHADNILISGYDGGTGASPQSSIRHAGIPWELGLSETHETLVRNGLRTRVRLQTDGQLKTGRDIIIAGMLGAEEFGFGTATLVVLGCVMMRKCHENTCPMGVATQDKELRRRFAGRPEHLITFFRFLAREAREIMASLGIRRFNDLIGRRDMLIELKSPKAKAAGLDLGKILRLGDRGQGTGDSQGTGDRGQGTEDRGQGTVGSESKPSTNEVSAVGTDMPGKELPPTPYPLPPAYCSISQIHHIDNVVDRELIEQCREILDNYDIPRSTLNSTPNAAPTVSTDTADKNPPTTHCPLPTSTDTPDKKLPPTPYPLPTKLAHPVHNTDRAVGAMLSYEVSKRYGGAGLPDGAIRVDWTGSAGQSFGAFLAPGIVFTLAGDANDYFGKGLSGGRLACFPPAGSTFRACENIIVGNTALYGATSGEAFVAGIAGERFCVRNSGANAVVEGAGDHCAEYMTGGRLVVLGQVGRNFAAGMSGGIAYVLDRAGNLGFFLNPGMVETEALTGTEEAAFVRGMVERHVQWTGSEYAAAILAHWDEERARFVKVIPTEYKKALLGR